MGSGIAPGIAQTAPQDRALPPWDAAPETLHLVAFGTSLTAGELWPQALAQTLGACLDRPVTLDVVAQAGMGSAWGLDQLARVRAATPDLVLMEFSINDADLLDGVSLAQSAAQHRAILEGLRGAPPDGAGAKVILMAMSPVTGLVRHAQRPRLGAYYGLYAELAQEQNTGFLDATARWHTGPGALRDALPDGVHPTPEAARDLLVPPLAALVATAVAGTPSPCPDIP